jgi:hypothetical protein
MPRKAKPKVDPDAGKRWYLEGAVIYFTDPKKIEEAQKMGLTVEKVENANIELGQYKKMTVSGSFIRVQKFSRHADWLINNHAMFLRKFCDALYADRYRIEGGKKIFILE